MCDPITIASVALMAAGTGAGMMGQNAVENARNDASAAERIRQAGYDREAAALNEGSRQRYDKFGEQQGQRAGELSKMYADVQGQVVGPPAAQGPAPNAGAGSVVTREAAKQKAAGDAFNQQQADAQGALSSFGDLLGQKSREQARDATLIGQIGNFKKGSAQANAYEMEAANSAGDGWKLVGDLARGIGSLGVGFGLRAPGGAGAGPLNLATVGSRATSIPTALPNAAPGIGSLFSLY